MTDAEKAKIILNLLAKHVDLAQRKMIEAYDNLRSAKTSCTMWCDFHPDDDVGGFDQNPYSRSVDLMSIKSTVASNDYDTCIEVQKYAIEKFLEDLEVAKDVNGKGDNNG